MTFSIIAAIDKERGIGKNNSIPWHLSGDFKHFAQVTKATHNAEKQNAVIMGLNTWKSLPDAYRPLPGRLNVVLNNESFPPSVEEGLGEGGRVIFHTSLDSALADLEVRDGVENVFIIGGGQVYASTITHPHCGTLYITEIHETFDCDTFFPKIPVVFKETFRSDMHEEQGVKYQFVTYEK